MDQAEPTTYLISVTGAWFFTMLICAWLLVVLTYFSLVLSFAAWKLYAAQGGRLPARLTEVATQFGITRSSPD
jgi:hypothetical protein